MSCAGNTDLNTPNIDLLATEGIRFTNAYCASPLSTPSRASMFTGIPSGYTQMMVNESQIAKEIRPNTLGNLLKNAGYECAYAGKWHLPTASMESDEWGFRVLHKFNDSGLADACSGFLAEKHLTPFFMVASFNNPHNICEYARGEKLPNTKLKPSPLAECPNIPFNYAIAPYEPSAIRLEQTTNKSLLYPTTNFTADDWRLYRDAYYRFVEQVDGEIGKIISALKTNNLLDNTIIVFSSDHGDGLGAHHWNQKSVLYEEVLNVPLIIRLPKAKNAGQVKGQLVNSCIDFFATICDYSEVKLPILCHGKSLRSVLENNGDSTELHPFIVSETMFDRGVTNGWMLRTPKFKYILYDRGEQREQLFNIKNDPGEMINLAVEKKYSGQLQQYKLWLEDWKKTNKTEFITSTQKK